RTPAAQPRICDAGRPQSRVLAPSAPRLCQPSTWGVEARLKGSRWIFLPTPPPHFHHLRLYEWGADLPGGTSLMASNGTSQSRVIGMAGIAMAVVGAGVGVLRSDLLLNRGFGNALQATRPGLSFDGTAAKAQDHAAAVGDEGYWLTRSEVESPAPFAKQL